MHVSASASPPAWAVTVVIVLCVASLAHVSSIPLPAFGQVELQDAPSMCCNQDFCGFSEHVARMAEHRARLDKYNADKAQEVVKNTQLNTIAQTVLTNRLEELSKLKADTDKIVEETCKAADEAAHSADEAENTFNEVANTNNEMKGIYGEVVEKQGKVAASKTKAQPFSSQAQIAGNGCSSLASFAATVGPVCESVSTDCETIHGHATTAATEFQAINGCTATVSAAAAQAFALLTVEGNGPTGEAKIAMAEARTAADNAAKSIPAALQDQKNGEKYYTSCAEKLQNVFSITVDLQVMQLQMNFLTYSIEEIEKKKAFDIQECAHCRAKWAGCSDQQPICEGVCNIINGHNSDADFLWSATIKNDLVEVKKNVADLKVERDEAQKLADESRRLAEAVKDHVESTKTIVEALKGRAESAKGKVEAMKTKVEAGKAALEGQKTIAEGAERDAEGHSDKTEEAAKETYKAVTISPECAQGLATVMPSTQQLFNLNSNPVCLVPPDICNTSG